MRPKFVIKLSSKSSKSKDKYFKGIVVGLNDKKSNGAYITKLGFRTKATDYDTIYNIDTRKLGLWLNKGAILKSKVSWIVGMLANAEKQRIKIYKKLRKKNEIKLKS